MKKVLSVLLAFLLLFFVTACGSKENSSQNDGTNVNLYSQEDGETGVGSSIPENRELSEDASTAVEVTESEYSLENEAVGQIRTGSNILIVYFSRWGNTDYPDDIDATTSASIVIDKDIRFGTTEYVANQIQQIVGGDLHRIETVNPYTTILMNCGM